MDRSSETRRSLGPLRIAAAYVVLSVAWIFVSDWAVGFGLGDPQLITLVQSAKGLGFVLASGAVIYWLVAREQRELEQSNVALERALRHSRVLHRLLRHNVRNNCDVIRNNVGLLAAGEVDAEACHERIERQVEDLVRMAEKCQDLRSVVFQENPQQVAQDIEPVLEEALEAARQEYPTSTTTVEFRDTPTVLAHPLLGAALEELIENAITHQEHDDPSVHVIVAKTDDEACIKVVDEGPGLPDVEEAVLTGATEHQLAHSRGVGLWFVRLVLEASNGTVDIDCGDGTAVEITLPLAPSEREASGVASRIPAIPML